MTPNLSPYPRPHRLDTLPVHEGAREDERSDTDQAAQGPVQSPAEFLFGSSTTVVEGTSDLGRIAGPALSLIFVERGSLTLRGGGREQVAVGGEIVVWSHTDQGLEASGVHSILRLTWMKPRAFSLHLHGTKLERTDGVAQVLAAQMSVFGARAPDFSQSEIGLIGEAAFALLRSAKTTVETIAATRSHLSEAILYIERYLGSENLGPTVIARELGLSRAALYRLFADRGGVTAYIQSRRLDRCFDLLRSGKGQDLAIATLAYRHGFVSKAHFSRRFKLRFGVSPRSVAKSELRKKKGKNRPQ